MRIEKCSYGGWDNCLELNNGEVGIVITLNVGPRVIFYGFVNGQNLLKNFDDDLGQCGSSEWKSYGGHRLWHAPEVEPRTYSLDNSPVAYRLENNKVILDCPEEFDNKIKKEIIIELSENSSEVKLTHRIYNTGNWDKELSAWCLTVMAPEGRAIIPQEPYVPHGAEPGGTFVPARPLVLWPFTKMNDSRFMWGEKYIQFSEDSSIDSKLKFGILNKQEWMAYTLNGELFIKKHPYIKDTQYPDYNCNAEFFTMPGFLELETLSPLKRIAPGDYVEHLESWQLFKVNISTDEADIDTKLLPLL